MKLEDDKLAFFLFKIGMGSAILAVIAMVLCVIVAMFVQNPIGMTFLVIAVIISYLIGHFIFKDGV